jgi:hypothetical protein
MLVQHRRGVRPLRRTIDILRTSYWDQRRLFRLHRAAAVRSAHMCPSCHAGSVSSSATMLPPSSDRAVLAFRSLSTPVWGSGMWPPVPLLRGSLASLSAGLLPVLTTTRFFRTSSIGPCGQCRLCPACATSCKVSSPQRAPALRSWRRWCRPPKRRGRRSAPPTGPSPRARSRARRAASAGSANARARRSARE